MAASTRALVMPYPELDNCSFTMRRRSAVKWSSSTAGGTLVCPRPSPGRIPNALRIGTAIFFTTFKIIPFAGDRHSQNDRVPISRFHLQFFRGGQFALAGVEGQEFPRPPVQCRRPG